MLASQNHKPICSYIIAGGDKWVNTGCSIDILVDARKYHCTISEIVTCFIFKSPVDITGNSRGWLFTGCSLTRQGENIKQAFASFCHKTSSCHCIRPKHWTRKCYSSMYYIHLKKTWFFCFVLMNRRVLERSMSSSLEYPVDCLYEQFASFIHLFSELELLTPISCFNDNTDVKFSFSEGTLCCWPTWLLSEESGDLYSSADWI